MLEKPYPRAASLHRVLVTPICVVIFFSFYFRPQILHPAGSLLLVPATLGLLGAICKPALFNRFAARLGFSFFLVLAFIFLWSLVIDFFSGGFTKAGLRSQSAVVLRFMLTILASFFVAMIVSGDREEAFRKFTIYAIAAQVFLGFLMFFFPEAKHLFYSGISGYTGEEKVFREHFYHSRIFGWSEELFFTAPVFMALATVYFWPARFSFTYSVFSFSTLLISLFNARLALLGFVLGAGKRFSWGQLVVFVLFFSFLIAVVLAVSWDMPAVQLFLADFQGGGSRTVSILLDRHIHFLFEDVAEMLFGVQEYLYAVPNRERSSDIGWVIILNYGGVVYLFLWLCLVIVVLAKAFPYPKQFFFGLLLVVAAAFKGLVFGGNALMAFLLCLAILRGGRRWRSMTYQKLV